MSEDDIKWIKDSLRRIEQNMNSCFDKIELVTERITVLETINAQYDKRPLVWQGWGALVGIFIGLAAIVVAIYK
jgi:hypothetical protein